MSKELEFTEEEILESRKELWYMGNLQWKLNKSQRRIIAARNKSNAKIFVINAGRRVGKSYALSILAIEQCLQNPNSIVKFIQPEKAQVQRNIIPIMEQICIDCPVDIRPSYKTQKSSYVFPNGSEIQFAGTDGNNFENLRGSDAHLCLIDEAGFLNAPLGYIIRSIFVQSTLRTKGKIVLSSSTPTDPNHEFVKYVQQAMLQERFIAVTTKDCLTDHEADGDENFTRDMYNEMVAEYPGGEADPEFRRECMNELVTDGTRSVIPEFSGEVKEQLVKPWKMPVFCDKYVAMDIGFKDLTVVLFAYYDYDSGLIVIQDELVMNGPKMTTEKLAEEIRKKEATLWTDSLTGEQLDPYMRVSDNNLILLNDLARMHGLYFTPTAKDNKEAQINNLRLEIGSARIIIDPRCKTLITHLTFATWDKQRKDFVRTEDGAHADAIDALIYLIRNVQRGRNPYPPGYSRTQLGSRENVFYREGKNHSDNEEKWTRVFKPKTRFFKPRSK
jgi:phage terminase large subunit